MGQATPFQSDEGFGSTESDVPDSSKTLRLKNYLHEKRNAKQISFENTNFDVNHGKIIAEWLKQNQDLKELKLGLQSIEDEGFRHIMFCLAFNKNQSLNVLNLTENRTMGSTALASLSSCISLNKNITRLNLSDTKLDKESLKFLCPSFEKTETLLELDLSRNSLNQESMDCICVFLSKNHSLKILNLNENDLGSNICCLSSFLETNDSLEILHLSKNNISHKDLKSLSESLRKNSSLKKLFMSSNNVSEEGSKYLADCLQDNRSLVELDVSYNSIKDEGASFLIGSLEANHSLKLLNLSGNFIGSSETGNSCKKCLVKNDCLECLNLSENSFESEGLQSILEGLSENHSLKMLHLEKNANVINFEIQQKIASILDQNKTVKL